MTDRDAYLRRQTLISVVISMAISAVFFFAVFRNNDPIAIWAPDHLAFDFLPQSVAASFMAALVPALQARAAIAKGIFPGVAPSIASVALRAILLAALSAGLAGCFIALFAAAGLTSLAWSTALAMKIAYGAMLGLVVTPVAVHAILKRG